MYTTQAHTTLLRSLTVNLTLSLCALSVSALDVTVNLASQLMSPPATSSPLAGLINSSEASADELQAVDAPHTSAAARVSPVAAPTKLGSAASRTTPVTVQPVATPPGQQTSMADQVGWAGERAVAPKGYEMRREAYDLSAHPR